LVWSGDGCTEAPTGDRLDATRGDTVRDDLRQRRERAGVEERLIEVAHDIAQVDEGLSVEHRTGNLGARVADAREPHEAPPVGATRASPPATKNASSESRATSLRSTKVSPSSTAPGISAPGSPTRASLMRHPRSSPRPGSQYCPPSG